MQLTTFRNAASSKSSGATGKKVLFRMKELACICQEIKERKDPLKCIHFTNSSLAAKDLTEHRSSLETSAAYVSRFISEHVTVCSVTWWVDIQLRSSMKQISDGVTAVHMDSLS